VNSRYREGTSMIRTSLTSLLVSILIATGVTGCKRSNQPQSERSTPPNGNSGIPGGIIVLVEQNIKSDPRLKSQQIQISFDHGTVTLQGALTREDEVIAAGVHAMDVAGVQSVANYLTYPEKNHSSQHILKEDEIRAAIRAAEQSIHSDARIKGPIQVSFVRFSQNIRLTGKVATEDERVAVLNAASKATDVGVMSTVGCVCADRATTLNAAPAPPWTGPPAPAEPIVPICPGLTVVTAVAQPQGDYESIKTIEALDSSQIQLKYSSEVMPPWWSTPHPQLQRVIAHRIISIADSESGHRYNQIFVGGTKLPSPAPGATAIGTSAEVLKELKTTGESELSICGDTTVVVDQNGRSLPAPGGCSSFMPMTLRRVGNEPVRLRVLMNGMPVDLPAIHARGQVGDERDEFFFLDDERNPLTLSFRLGIGAVPALKPAIRKACETVGRLGQLTLGGDGPPSCDLPDGGDRDVLRVVKIETKCSVTGAATAAAEGTNANANALEKSLAVSGTVDVYSIYFSFNSDELREESEPTLKEIADVLRKHRDWKLRIAGHTDGVGNDENNLDLSKRRAGAVKDALVKRYKIDGGQLSTAGFGKSQPKDTNETVEGRAHNRRVELRKI
jgi:outer membrane protein OmpA-like peptidoglycan-associated protein